MAEVVLERARGQPASSATLRRSTFKQMCERAAMLWDIDPEAVDWKNGHAHPAGANAGDFEPWLVTKAPR